MMTKLHRLIACLILILTATPSAAQIERVRAAQLQPDRCVDGQPRVVLVVDSVDALTCDPASTGTAEALCCCLDGGWASCASGIADGSVTAAKLDTGNAPSNGKVLGYSAGSLNWESTAAPNDGDYGDVTVSGTGTVMSLDADAVGVDQLDTTNSPAQGRVIRYDSGSGGVIYWDDAPSSDIYTLHFSSDTSLGFSPADATTYYFGGWSASIPQTTADLTGVAIPYAGFILGAQVASYCSTAGSNNSWSMVIRLNNTSDTTIVSLAAATNRRVWSNLGLGITVSAGDRFEIKTTTPSWGTNPAGCRFWGHLAMRRSL